MKTSIKILAIALCLTIFTACAENLQNSARIAGNKLAEDVSREITERSEHLADNIKALPYIEHATATIIGKSALIGVDLDKNYTETDIMKIKSEVKRKAFLSDANLNRVTVSVTPHLIDKATDFAGEQENPGHIISDEMEENSVPTAPTL